MYVTVYVCMCVCLTITFESLDVGSSFSYMRYIAREYGSCSYICMERHLADVITCAKFQDEIFRGYDFTGGRISHFPIHFAWALQQQRYCAACDDGHRVKVKVTKAKRPKIPIAAI